MEKIDKFLEKCKIKTINGKKYYYIDNKFLYFDGVYKHAKHQEIYIGSIDDSKEELSFKIDLAQFKRILKTIKFHYDMSKRHYTCSGLKEKEQKRLIFLRWAYSSYLYQFSQSDLDRYEKSVYTQYVHGTTSVEGNTYTLRETDLTLNEGLTVSGKEKREFFEIENYNKLQTYLKSQDKIKFDESFVKKIHSIIMSNIDDDSAGEYRKIDVGIRGANFEPVQAILVPDEMKHLFEWFEDEIETTHFLEIIAKFHQKFEEIHPFKDGNGRVGRELIRVWLAIHGLPTIFIDKKNREEYLKCLDKGNSGNHTLLIKFLYNNLIEFHDELIQTSMHQIKTDLEDKTKDERYNKIFTDKKVKKLLDWLMSE
jgi:Fic family protein